MHPQSIILKNMLLVIIMPSKCNDLRTLSGSHFKVGFAAQSLTLKHFFTFSLTPIMPLMQSYQRQYIY